MEGVREGEMGKEGGEGGEREGEGRKEKKNERKEKKFNLVLKFWFLLLPTQQLKYFSKTSKL